jgi:hypothetical protein
MGQMAIVAVTVALLFAIVMLRTVFIQNEIYRPLESVGGSRLRRLRILYYLFFFGGIMLAIVGALTQANWLREIGLWIWIASVPIFFARMLELQRRGHERRKGE